MDIDALREPLTGATPRSCLAVRFGRGHTEAAEGDALLSCQICGALPGASTCEPLLVGGEVIGVVLISHAKKLDEAPRQRNRETVAQAAPVLANLRNLALAQLQAATDVAGIKAPEVDRITASVGVAVLPDDAGDAVTLFRSADRALYLAKNNGRDRVETITAEEHSPTILTAAAAEVDSSSSWGA